MTGLEELEMLAKDTEELGVERQADKAMMQALLSIAYRIRHAAKRIKADEAPSRSLGVPVRG